MDAKGGFRLQMSEKLSRVRPGGGRDRLAHSENVAIFGVHEAMHCNLKRTLASYAREQDLSQQKKKND